MPMPVGRANLHARIKDGIGILARDWIVVGRWPVAATVVAVDRHIELITADFPAVGDFHRAIPFRRETRGMTRQILRTGCREGERLLKGTTRALEIRVFRVEIRARAAY